MVRMKIDLGVKIQLVPAEIEMEMRIKEHENIVFRGWRDSIHLTERGKPGDKFVVWLPRGADCLRLVSWLFWCAREKSARTDREERQPQVRGVRPGPAMQNLMHRLWLSSLGEVVDTINAENAYDACNYFIDDLTSSATHARPDEKEQKKHEHHSALREACSRGDTDAVRRIVESIGEEAELVINMAPSGSNTLLFTACEVGQKEIVKILLENEADGRIHPVTKYSPLYIACYYGRKDIVELLLKKFPELVQQQTVEKWLPVHACCINGHVAVLELLLKFAYPSRVMCTLRDKSGEWAYDMPFDLNARDVTGQSVLYLACYVGNQKLVDCLLKFRVKANRINALRIKEDEEQKANDILSPTRRRISNGIQSIMSKLNLSKQEPTVSNETELSPLLLDLYCNNNTETALHVAVKCKHHNIISALLMGGANPNLPILANEEELSRDEGLGSASGSTSLVEACRNRDLTALDLLLKYGARDDECRALEVAYRDEIMCAKLLATKAHTDPEYKINKKAMSEVSPSQFASASSLGSLTYGSLFPNTAVMINWHGQNCLSHVKPQWLVDAALTVNPRLRLNPKHQDVVLYSITRLDISRNSLTSVPIAVFQLQSLRYLNLSQNKLERLPSNEEKSTVPLSKSGRNRVMAEAVGYIAPVLEEIHLQFNRLEQIPEEIFQLPALVSLDVSNNKLQSLPYLMWKASKLKELNASFNLLRELPTHQQGITVGIDVTSLTSEQIMIRSDSFSSQTSLGRGQEDKNSSCNDVSELTDDSLQDAQTLNSCVNKGKFVQNMDLKHLNIWSKNVEVNDQILHADEDSLENCSQLSALNLAHNAFSCIPSALPCLAVNLTRLNLSYNNLRSMGHVTSYPSTLKQLDLSHNQICCWPSLPQLEALDAAGDMSHLNCYCPSENTKPKKTPILSGRLSSSKSLRSMILNSVCTHRRHLKLDSMRTLILADNCLERIQLSTDDDGGSIAEEDEAEDLDPSNPVVTGKSKLMFPNLSMLDISNNNLHEIPRNINELNNLSVLNISGNPDINELPPQMGLLSRLWNLNTNGCSLQEPLKSMIESKKYKTMDVIGYLKSVLEDAKPYARIKLMIVGVQGIGKTSLLEQLRMEGHGSYKKKPVEHWAKRMGNKNINVKTSRGTNMSTVGVDIGDWVYEKRGRSQNSFGPVVFRTWDFGGQKEYYATHQYFLSKRSLYLVVWRIPDGPRGIAEILQWLVNIQARAPNSPVLIVGTHYDMAKDLPCTEDLQQLIREKFINIVDAEKCGLPRVLDTIEISCKTRHNVKHLCNLIYDTVYSLRPPGSKELLLEQRVPASYLALEDVVSVIAAERRALGADPVLLADEYKAKVAHELQARYHRTFRDGAELNQATAFLHENGVLLHYDDATLKDLYFLDPQWLCDMLAHVVTIREINPFARTGVMKLDDLKHVFKSSSIGPVDKRGYIVNLLNKFEVALTWDSRTLLIPSLLLSEEQMRGPHPPEVRVKIPVRSRGWAVRTKKAPITQASTLVGNSSFYTPSNEVFRLQKPNSSQISGPKRGEDLLSPEQPVGSLRCEVTTKSDPESSIRRLLLMSYFPSGFWSRLMTRILADDAIVDIVRSYFTTPKEVINDASLAPILEHRADWVLWQTGMELRYFDTTLFRMKEVLPTVQNTPVDYRQMRFKLKQEGTWTDVDFSNSSILELYFPVETLVLKRAISEDAAVNWGPDSEYQSIVLDPSMECVTKLLALAVDHIDILLEDWYPTLGTRFVHTSEGRFLVTRLVPCPKCVASFNEQDGACALRPDAWMAMDKNNIFDGKKPFEDMHREDRVRKSQESYTSCDSGVEPDSAGSSRTTSFEGHPAFAGLDRLSNKSDSDPLHYSWLVEECILAAYDKKSVGCPLHGDIGLPSIAPDTMFLDLGERHLIRPDNIKRGKLLGRGAFGFVFRGNCKMRGSSQYADVAMKMLQPVQPGGNARPSAIIAFKAAQGKWERDPLQYACKAYCTARQELNILLSLRHPYIVPLVGICTHPLALVLDLAPQGALDTTLRHYRRSGAKLGPYVLQAVILQVAKAIEYLHQQHIIYRDLKSENVLVWDMPAPFTTDPLARVHVKLADYGISRLTLPSGTKGFGGTEGFMAPEIMRYNGEEEYTDKVDCFSFGMFIYELLTLHQPFEGQESVKECILEGGRPSLCHRETLYPGYILDLMVLCWAQQPRDRPSASHIVSIASAPEFTHLSDVIALNHSSQVSATTAVPVCDSTDESSSELWLGCINNRADLLLATNGRGWCNYCTLNLPGNPTAACQVGSSVWLGDHKGYIHAYLASDCTLLFSYNMEPDAPVPCPVVSMLWLHQLQRVAVAMANGRLFMVRSDVMPSASTMGEGSFVMTELGNSSVLHAITAIYKDNGR
ncbi:Hypothetical predicted protein [Cloeon dipterum]|uniref:non-specific serine/threonine protein kinase n=3 Tax=Cloeon dipterum TaxID=197152 RepID=A0A8S1DNC8_9INSE|nr:Hypothetical predicted protein [Cloeon dipterum]